MLIIGLTGGVATGKSTVRKMFVRAGAGAIDADNVVHRTLARGTSEHKKIVSLLGRGILKKNGTIDRMEMARAIFCRGSKKLLKKVENIIHPTVLKKMMVASKKAQKDGKRIFVMEVPLLFEVGWNRKVDVIVVAACPGDVASRRCPPNFKGRSVFQIPMKTKIKKADYVIDTSGAKTNTYKQVKALYKKLCGD
jgi:dephospho-CoA kinase